MGSNYTGKQQIGIKKAEELTGEYWDEAKHTK
jgi:hypothetical protein